MKKAALILSIIIATAAAMAAPPERFDNEHLTFRVTYKWGIIQKVAGSAEITLTRHDDHYATTMTTRTLPWADRIFMVRDTLKGRMRLADLSPTLYDKSTHEPNDVRHDVLHYDYHGNRAVVNSHRRITDKKGNVTLHDTVMTALLPAVDMLSVYYHVRSLPFETMTPGSICRANIFSGNKIEKLAITYDGDETIDINGQPRDCFRIHFMFSSERVKNTSKPMKAWLEKTGSRIPVKLEGELPVGKIQIIYND